MSNFPEDLEIIICRLGDEGWTEHSYVFFDGDFDVTMLKGNKKLHLKYSNQYGDIMKKQKQLDKIWEAIEELQTEMNSIRKKRK